MQGDEYLETMDTQDALSFADDADTDPIGIVDEDYINGAGYSNIPHILLFAMPLPDPQYRTYCVIKALCQQKGQMWWSIYSISCLRNKSRETIRAHLEDLQYCGLIRKQTKEGKDGKRTFISLCRLESVFPKIVADALGMVLWGKRMNDIEADLLPVAEKYAEVLRGGAKPQKAMPGKSARDAEKSANKTEKSGNRQGKIWHKELIRKINKEERGPHVPTIEELAGKLPPLELRTPPMGAGGLSAGRGDQVRKEQLARDRVAKREQVAAAKAALDAMDGRVRAALEAFMAGTANGGKPSPVLPQMIDKHGQAARDMLNAGYTPEQIGQAARWFYEKWAGKYTLTLTNMAANMNQWANGNGGNGNGTTGTTGTTGKPKVDASQQIADDFARQLAEAEAGNRKR